MLIYAASKMPLKLPGKLTIRQVDHRFGVDGPRDGSKEK